MNPDESNREVEVPIDRGRLPRRLRRASESASPPAPRIPRITRLMALAIKFDDMIRRGEVRGYADLARLGHVTRARITQIMNLLNLAPDIQEELLLGAPLQNGTAQITEPDVRQVAALVHWAPQRAAFGSSFTLTEPGQQTSESPPGRPQR